MPAESDPLSMWIVMFQPRDMPGSVFVARRWQVMRGGALLMTDELRFADNLLDLRKQLPPRLHRIPRHATDDPHIVECWL